jgi:hypothetical protein
MAALATWLLAHLARPFVFAGYYQTSDNDFQAAWVKKVHTTQGYMGGKDTASCFGMPNQLLCHLLDAYSEGMRRHNDFNGGICARIDDSPGSEGRAYRLTPFDDIYADDPISFNAGLFHAKPEGFNDAAPTEKYGANQLGFPDAVTATRDEL